MRRFESNGVKRGHAFGDIGDSLGGRAKLRLATMTTWGAIHWWTDKIYFGIVINWRTLGLEREAGSRSPWRSTSPNILRWKTL